MTDALVNVVTNAICICVIHANSTLAITELASTIGKDTRTVLIGGIRAVVTGRSVGTTGNFICVANAIAIPVIGCNTTIAITSFTRLYCVNTISCIRCGWIVVTSHGVLTTNNLVSVTNTVAIGVEVLYDLAIANFTWAISKDTRTIVLSHIRIVVTSISVRTASCFVGITNTITIGILDNHSAIAVTNFTVAIGKFAVTCISCGCVVVACISVLATNDFVTITNTVSVCILNCYSAVAVTHFTIAISKNTVSGIRRSCVVVAG